MRIGIIGGGYIGSAIASTAAFRGGHDVWVYDIDPLNCKHAMRWEDGYTSFLVDQEQVIDALKSCDIFLICVNTPEEGPQPVEDAIEWLYQYILRPGGHHYIIIESSVPTGFTRHKQEQFDLYMDDLPLPYLHFAHSPERIWPGHVEEWPLEKIPKLVGGITPEVTKRAADFYRSFIDRVIECESPEVTEFAKLYENTQRTANIAYTNMAEILAKRHGINFEQVLAACRTKPFGYADYHPGAAGGTCLPPNAAYFGMMCSQEEETAEFFGHIRGFAKQ